jgi:hypothetical protein
MAPIIRTAVAALKTMIRPILTWPRSRTASRLRLLAANATTV